MRTTKPISTISFNTKDFLKLKLNELTKAKILSFWAFIEHKPEDDEGGKKIHYHVYLEPSRMVQTDDIKESLKEYDPTNPEKPLGTISFTTSKFDPWYLYALHDKRYLVTKHQTRRFHYKHDDIVASDSDDLLCKARSIDLLSLSPYEDILNAQAQGISFSEYFARGTIPLPQVALFERAWYLLAEGSKTNRDGNEGHPMEPDHSNTESNNPPSDDGSYKGYVDPISGEVKENAFWPVLPVNPEDAPW